ncbi:NAD(P)/FAD-dependent oxidoreductase [Liquorilactobacillus sicerae]|uniref:NAD(P)/FAD-dependent oxidoreductase n=1 Tax=Liquorilactobacillus sicerae TaxID=1416943 RepID=UPI002480EE75|nr:FAD-dependent oxidoreductase [Liquorilactobacillus sicerae]
MAKQAEHFNYLLIGGGMATDQAAAGIRSVDQSGTIAILSADVDEPYARPALSKKLWVDETFQESDTDFKTAEKQNVEIHLQTVVTKIDPAAHQVETAKGTTYAYDKLLLATGVRPKALPNLPASDLIVALRSKADYRKIRAFSGQQKQVIVVGNGYIGSEIAAGLIQAQTKVSYVIASQHLLDQKLPTKLSRELEERYIQAGVEFYRQKRAVGAQIKAQQVELTLDDGTVLSAAGLVLGLGSQPDYQLAQTAGVIIDEAGVVVDQHLQTSVKDIFAAGDLISYPDPILGQTKSEHVMHATKSGFAAGQNMAGQVTAYNYTPYFYSWVFDVTWEALGTIKTDLKMYQEKIGTRGSITYYFDQADTLQGILKWNVKINLNHLRNLLSRHPQLAELKKVLPLTQVD